MNKRNPNKARPLLNIFKRYREKNERANKNYFRHADAGNWRRATYWEMVALKWARKARKQFPEFCA